MNIETLGQRVVLLQQQVDLHAQQYDAIGNNLKILRGHLGEAQYWLNLAREELEPGHVTEGEPHAIEEGNQPESHLSEHQDGEGSGETTESSGCDSVE